jgi:hypothetical protein
MPLFDKLLNRKCPRIAGARSARKRQPGLGWITGQATGGIMGATQQRPRSTPAPCRLPILRKGGFC